MDERHHIFLVAQNQRQFCRFSDVEVLFAVVDVVSSKSSLNQISRMPVTPLAVLRAPALEYLAPAAPRSVSLLLPPSHA